MQVQLKLLWDLQELDLSISNLQQKLEEAPLISGVQETTDKLNELAIEITERELRLKEDRKTLKQLEKKTQKIVEDRKEISENL
jgi:allophanate hydrolase subunit 1